MAARLYVSRHGQSNWTSARDAACDRHFAAHPEDRDANVVIFKFHDEEMAEESQGNEPKLVEHVVDQPAFAA